MSFKIPFSGGVALRALAGFILTLSFALFSFLHIVPAHYSPAAAIVTVFASVACASIFFVKTSDAIVRFYQTRKALLALVILAALAICWKTYLAQGQALSAAVEFVPIDFFRARWYLLSSLGFAYALSWLMSKAILFIDELRLCLTREERIVYCSVAVVASLIVVLLYFSNPDWYLQYDAVYSMDSGFCFERMFSNPGYYDVRHPLMGLIAFPLWAVADTVAQLFAPEFLGVSCTAVLLQVVNVQLMLAIAAMLRVMTDSRWIPALYVCSMPFILFTAFFEKYQLCVFLLVLYFYLGSKSEDRGILPFVLAVGVMPTNVFAVLYEFSIKRLAAIRVKRIAKMVALGIVLFVCFGRVGFFSPDAFVTDITAMSTGFASRGLTIEERVFSVFSMLEGCIFGLDSIAGDRFVWASVLSKPSLLSLLIMAMIVIGAVSKRKEPFTKACILWVLFSAVLFVGLNWAPYESPLFSLLFSWATIPLFCYGVERVTDLAPSMRRPLQIAVSSLVLMVNLGVMVNLASWLY